MGPGPGTGPGRRATKGGTGLGGPLGASQGVHSHSGARARANRRPRKGIIGFISFELFLCSASSKFGNYEAIYVFMFFLCLLSSLSKNRAESLRNSQKLFINPKRANIKDIQIWARPGPSGEGETLLKKHTLFTNKFHLSF